VRIDQFVTELAERDAIGQHTLALRGALRRAGYESDIWVDAVRRPLRREVRHYLEYPHQPGERETAILYQVSWPSAMADWLERWAADGGRLFTNYHNITPTEYFTRWDPAFADDLARGRSQVAQLAAGTELAIAVSEFNERELRALGYRHTATSPPLFDLAALEKQPDRRALARIDREQAAGGARWLFVGRLSPNKCQHDVIGAFAVYRRVFDPAARLVLVGAPSSWRYLRALQQLASDLGVRGSVAFPGSVSPGELRAEYARAGVFVCCSEHEGFCVPAVEAMARGVPVVAYAAAAIPDTVGAGALLLNDKDPVTVAAAVVRQLGDGELRRGQVAAARERAAGFSLETTSRQFLEVLRRHFEGSVGKSATGDGRTVAGAQS
jgi:L-malate glycosyltransferase